MEKKKVIFGLGTGRCGSASLAYLLNEQRGAMVGHEMSPVMPWATNDLQGIQFRWEQLQHQSHLYPIVGDVGIYYLPYVPMLMKSWQAVPFLNQNYDYRFIILERDKDEVIESYLEKFKRQNNNPLQTEKAEGVKVDEWDECFPKYDGVSLREAIGLFWDDYHTEAHRLVKLYPQNVFIVPTEDLSTEAGVQEIMDFVGIENPRVLTDIRKNES